MMQGWSLLIGARRRHTKRRRFPRADDRLVQAITRRHFPDGFTILQAVGGWFDPSEQKFIREESRQILINGATSTAIRRWARELGQALEQKELIVIQLGKALRLRISDGARRRPPAGIVGRRVGAGLPATDASKRRVVTG